MGMGAFNDSKLTVINLNDLYISKDEFNSSLRTLHKKINKVSFFLGVVTGLLIVEAIDTHKRVIELEKEKNKETAG